MTNENFARLLLGLTIAVGNRKNRILIYQFLASEIRALHYSYGLGDDESYTRALTFLEECERFTLRSLMRKSAERHVEVTVDHAKRVLLRALKKLNTSPVLAANLVESNILAIANLPHYNSGSDGQPPEGTSIRSRRSRHELIRKLRSPADEDNR